MSSWWPTLRFMPGACSHCCPPPCPRPTFVPSTPPAFAFQITSEWSRHHRAAVGKVRQALVLHSFCPRESSVLLCLREPMASLARHAGRTPSKSMPSAMHVHAQVLQVDGPRLHVSFGVQQGRSPPLSFTTTFIQVRALPRASQQQPPARLLLQNRPHPLGLAAHHPHHLPCCAHCRHFGRCSSLPSPLL